MGNRHDPLERGWMPEENLVRHERSDLAGLNGIGFADGHVRVLRRIGWRLFYRRRVGLRCAKDGKVGHSFSESEGRCS